MQPQLNSAVTRCSLLLGRMSAIVTVAFVLAGPTASAEYGIIYPSLRQPYSKIFEDIVSGINQEMNNELPAFAVTKNTPPDDLSRWLGDHSIDRLFVLGKRSRKLARKTGLSQTLHYGAMLLNPGTGPLSGITLTSSPKFLFKKIKTICPTVKNIHLVYKSSSSDWIIDIAKKQAQDNALRLIVHKSDSLKGLAVSFDKTLASMNNKTDALWISHNGVSIDKSILRQVLVRAWRHRLLIFSGNLSDVRRGALFAMFPDNHKMGRSLALLATHEDSSPRIEMVQDLQVAINIRTARHLGLQFTEEELDAIDLVYPSK